MSQNAFDVGAPIPTVNAAVEARMISSLKSGAGRREPGAARTGRDASQGIAIGSSTPLDRRSTRARSRSYAQGMALLRMASKEYGYDIDPGRWRRSGGRGASSAPACSPRFATRTEAIPGSVNLCSTTRFSEEVSTRQAEWRYVVQTAIGLGIPVPALSASLAYYDAYRTERLPANLTQAQRDFFGAHTYRRIDREGVFHTEWTSSEHEQLRIPAEGALDFLSLGALVHRLDPGIMPFRKASQCAIHVSGGEFNTRREPLRLLSACKPASPPRWSTIRSAI